jgi:hypothetical protein
MTKREYLKYNREMYDMQNKRIYPGDTVIINNNYRAKPEIGIVSHFAETNKVAIKVPSSIVKGIQYYYNCYREPENIVKIKDGNKDNSKDSTESQSEFTE